MQAKIPGSYMRDYGIGDRIDDEVLEAFDKGEKEYYSEVLDIERDKVIKTVGKFPSFTILPTHIESYCKSCGQNDVERPIAVVIENGVFTEVLYGAQRKGSIMHGRMIIPELVLENEQLRSQLLEAVEECFNGPSENLEPTPCPYCREPLRTSKSLQCFSCHRDWHDPENVIKHKVKPKRIKKKKNLDAAAAEAAADKAVREALGLD